MSLRKLIFIFLVVLALSNVSYSQLITDIDRMPGEFNPRVRVLYRKSTADEREAIKPRDEDLKKYAAFLSAPGTGLLKLSDNSACEDNTRVLVVTDNCRKYTMPGNGAAYSFRVDDYRTQSVADITYLKNSFQATGDLIHGILTRIGDVPLEKVDLETPGVKYLTDFRPTTEYKDALKIAATLVNGVQINGFVYRRGLYALENTTYVLRSVAYNGTFIKIFNGIVYNELKLDKRKDVIIAFRIVHKDPDGSVTILWKKLAEKESPKIKGGPKKAAVESAG